MKRENLNSAIQLGDFAKFRVLGDIMNSGTSDAILKNDILTCVPVPPSQLQNLEIDHFDFVINHFWHGHLIARITAQDWKTGKLELNFLNGKYENTSVELMDCSQVYKITELTRSRKRD